SLIARQQSDGTGECPPIVHALHTLTSLPGFDAGAAEVILPCLKHPASGVRRAAIRAAPRTAAFGPAILGRVQDSDPLIRRDALLALSEMPPMERTGEQLEEALQQP